MRPGRGYVDYLEDIRAAIWAARRFAQGMTLEQFAADEKTVYATVRALEIMGEAAKRVPSDVRARRPAVPWRSMAAIRDVVIHEYDRIDRAVVWKTVQSDLPEAELAAARALDAEMQAEDGEGV